MCIQISKCHLYPVLARFLRKSCGKWKLSCHLSLSKLNIKSKNFFYKSCSFCYAIWEWYIKVIDICYSLFVTCYMLLAVWTFYLKLVITCKNWFLWLVVVRLAIFTYNFGHPLLEIRIYWGYFIAFPGLGLRITQVWPWSDIVFSPYFFVLEQVTDKVSTICPN